MAKDAGSTVVAPGGRAFLEMLFGPGFNPYAPTNDVSGLFGDGGMLGGGKLAMDIGRQGGFVAPGDPAAAYARDDAIGRFADAGDSWDRFYNTPVMGDDGSIVAPSPMQSAGARSFQGFGGRDGPLGTPLDLNHSDLLQHSNSLFDDGQGGGFFNDPYLRPGRAVDDLIPSSQWRTEGEQGKYIRDPKQAAQDVYDIRGGLGALDPSAIAQQGVGDVGSLVGRTQGNLDRYGQGGINDTLGLGDQGTRDARQIGQRGVLDTGAAGSGAVGQVRGLGSGQVGDVLGMGRDAARATRALSQRGVDETGDAGRTASQRTRAISQRGVSDVSGIGNQYEDDLMRSIDERAQQSLGVQMPEVMSQMRRLGLSESGAGERLGGDVASRILGDANREKVGALAQMREANLGRSAQAIGQRTSLGASAYGHEADLSAGAIDRRTGLGADAYGRTASLGAGAAGQAGQQGTEAILAALGLTGQAINQRTGLSGDASRLGTQLGAQAIGAATDMSGRGALAGQDAIAQAIGQRTGVGAQAGENTFNQASGAYQQAQGQGQRSLDQIYGTTADILKQGQADAAQSKRSYAGMMQDALGRADQSEIQRLIAESNAQSQGLHDYSGLVNNRDQYRGQRLDEMLKLGDYQRGIDQETLNQQMQFGMMPMNYLMQLISGIQTGGGVTPGRTTPWWQSALANAGAGAAGRLGAAAFQAPQSFFEDNYK